MSNKLVRQESINFGKYAKNNLLHPLTVGIVAVPAILAFIFYGFTGLLISLGVFVPFVLLRVVESTRSLIATNLENIAKNSSYDMRENLHYDAFAGLRKIFVQSSITSTSVIKSLFGGKCNSLLLNEIPFYGLETRSPEYKRFEDDLDDYYLDYNDCNDSDFFRRHRNLYGQHGTLQNRLVFGKRGTLTLETEMIPNAGKFFDDMLESARELMRKS